MHCNVLVQQHNGKRQYGTKAASSSGSFLLKDNIMSLLYKMVPIDNVYFHLGNFRLYQPLLHFSGHHVHPPQISHWQCRVPSGTCSSLGQS